MKLLNALALLIGWFVVIITVFFVFLFTDFSELLDKTLLSAYDGKGFGGVLRFIIVVSVLLFFKGLVDELVKLIKGIMNKKHKTTSDNPT